LKRRVFTFPSGFAGEIDLELLVRLGGGFGFRLLVGRREDAERDGDSGFKIQVDDFPERESPLLLNLPKLERKIRRFLWLLSRKKSAEAVEEGWRYDGEPSLCMTSCLRKSAGGWRGRICV
jgi:hypothetical protein